MTSALSTIDATMTAPTAYSRVEYQAGGISATNRSSSNAYRTIVEATVALPRNVVFGVIRFFIAKTTTTIAAWPASLSTSSTKNQAGIV